jgi:hypothetical protein
VREVTVKYPEIGIGIARPLRFAVYRSLLAINASASFKFSAGLHLKRNADFVSSIPRACRIYEYSRAFCAINSTFILLVNSAGVRVETA